MKLISFLLLLIISLNAQDKNKLTIDANNFNANDKKNIITFAGDVKMKQYKDIIKANKLVVILKQISKDNTKKEPIKYTATGSVHLETYSNQKHYICKGNKVIYDPKNNKYIIIGDGYAKDLTEDRELFGDKIYIDTISGEAKIDGSKKKPVRFIMKLNSKN